MNAPHTVKTTGAVPDDRTRWLVEAFAALIVTLGCATEYVALGSQATSALPGSQAAAYGVMLGVLTAVIGVPLSALGASTRPMISGPRVAATVLMSQLVGQLLLNGQVAVLGIKAVMALSCVAVLIAGVFQLALGALRGGSLVRMVPAPVLSGLLFGVAGLAMSDQFAFVTTCVFDWHFATLGVVALGVAAHFGWKGLCRGVAPRVKLPPGLSMFAALLVSAAAYYAVVAVLPAPPAACRLVGVAGLDLGAWRPLDFPLWQRLAGVLDLSTLAWVIGYGMAIGFIASIDTVIAVSSIESLTQRRGSVDRDLTAFGALNMLLGVLALLPCVGSVTRSTMAIAAGAQTRVVALLHAALVLLALTAGVQLVAMLPKLSAAVVVIVMSLDMIDDWSRSMTAMAFSDTEPRRVIGCAMWLFLIEAGVTLFSAQPSIGFFVGCVAGALLGVPSPRSLEVRWDEPGEPGKLDTQLRLSAKGALLSYNVERKIVGPLLRRLQSSPPARIALDLSEVARIDASACRALVQLDVFCAKRGVALRFILAHPSDGRAGQVAVAMRAFQRTDSLDFAAPPSDSATLAVTG